MKLAAYRYHGHRSWGSVVDDSIVPIAGAGDVGDLGSYLEHSAEPPKAGVRLAMAEVEILPPVDMGRKILCIGLNYADHIREMNREFPTKPTVFTRFSDTLVGDGAPIIAPHASEKFDYEGEFCIVIGRSGRYISSQDALEHVLGYTLMNDGSVRDYQRHSTQFTPGKNFPHSGSLGPYILSKDEFGSIAQQSIRTYLDDELMQSSDIGQLVFDVPTLIAYVSEWTELAVGDIIATGTPGGVGDGRTPPRYMIPGDRVRVEVDGLGTLTNPVVEDDRGPKRGE